MAQKTNRKPSRQNDNGLFSDLRIKDGKRKRPLNKKEMSDLAAMLATKERPEALDVAPLIPKGSFIQRLTNHFKDTDVSYSLPLFQLVMLASSWLTQNGAVLEVEGLKPHRPILWTIALAPSGSSKTLATDRVSDILSPEGEKHPVDMFPVGATDAQWIIDLFENNGSYWYQDEVGKFLKSVLTQSNYLRIKPWMLDAYSSKPVSNRLKGEVDKMQVEDPHFTFYGLTVRETWKSDIDLSSMLDGLCQRFNYVIAEPRKDTDMFEHFLFHATAKSKSEASSIQEIWLALCNQPGACDPYTLAPETLPFIEKWWHDLRPAWRNSALPSSFIRRIGFSVLSYLPVIHFLLGLSNRPIGIETAEIATRFADFHLESALVMIREYDNGWSDQIQTVVRQRERMVQKGNPCPTPRDINRSLSAKARQNLTTARIKEIQHLVEAVENATSSPLFCATTELSEQLLDKHLAHKAQTEGREEWRNRKRIDSLRKSHRNKPVSPKPLCSSDPIPVDEEDLLNVVCMARF
jgi:hypothetical protein